MGVANNGDYNLHWIDSAFSGGAYSLGSGDALGGGYGTWTHPTGGGYIDILFSGGVKAVAFDFGLDGLNPEGGDLFQITLSNGQVVNGTHAGRPEFNFFGVTSNEAITSVRVRSQTSSLILLDNLEYGNAVADAPAVPEPASVLLLLPALAILSILKLRRVN